MSMSGGYDWNANDYSNLITISSAAVASVLLVLFKSRCSNISLCWGLWSCARVVKEESDDEETGTGTKKKLPQPEPEPEPEPGA